MAVAVWQRLRSFPTPSKICWLSSSGGCCLVFGWLGGAGLMVGCGHSRGCPLPAAQRFAPLPNSPLTPCFTCLNRIDLKVRHPGAPVSSLMREIGVHRGSPILSRRAGQCRGRTRSWRFLCVSPLATESLIVELRPDI